MKHGEDVKRRKDEESVGPKHMKRSDRKLQEAGERSADGMFIILLFMKHVWIIKG
jgi:hypothetical protein